MKLVLVSAIAICLLPYAAAQAKHKKTLHCPAGIDPKADDAIDTVTIPPTKRCVAFIVNGFPSPDPDCTPGAVNPSLTLAILQDKNFTTKCVRDKATSATKKHVTYTWYHIKSPANNTGTSQTCELDHLISLELGGADTLDNIWPQCGPARTTLMQRYFKRKDAVENFLAYQVCKGQMELSDAQKGIAKDWTQFLAKSEQACPGGKCPKCGTH